jgi:polysaccharide biosynthesis protein PelF
MTGSYRSLYDQLAASPDGPRQSRRAAAGRCPVDHGSKAGARTAQTGETR